MHVDILHVHLKDHVHLAEAWKSFVPDRGKELLHIGVRHKLENVIPILSYYR